MDDLQNKTKLGRPPREYKPEYADMLINHMEQGFSFESFAGIIRCGKDVLYRWLDTEPNFQDARSIGAGLLRLFFEKKGLNGMESGKEFNAVVWLAYKRNMFGWDKKEEPKNNSTTGKLIIDFGKSEDE
jgi:hypothetical protein